MSEEEELANGGPGAYEYAAEITVNITTRQVNSDLAMYGIYMNKKYDKTGTIPSTY